MTYFIETYGCQVNFAEQAAQKKLFSKYGWQEAPSTGAVSEAPPELVVINTCSVRKTAEERFLGRLAHYAAQKKARAKTAKPLKIAIAGCAAAQHGEALFEKGADYLLGSNSIKNLESLLQNFENGSENDYFLTENSYLFYNDHHETGAHKSFLPIMTGCNNFCSYCIVPYLRGREISRPANEIIAEIERLSTENVREITLLGQNVNAYNQKDDKYGAVDFALLIKLIGNAVKNSPVRRLRFLSAHPKDMSKAVINALAETPLFCRHIHLPVQHGSNRVLKAMNRHYTREIYLDLIDELRAALPGVTFTTDILVGFPGETEADMEELLSLMENVRFTEAFMYHYNPREGTQAALLSGRIAEDVKRARLSRVIETQTRHSAAYLSGRLGGSITALVDKKAPRGQNELLCEGEHGESVIIKDNGEKAGDFVEITLEKLQGKTFRGAVK